MSINNIRITIAVISLVIGLVIAFFGYRKWADHDPVLDWSTTKGVILSSKKESKLAETSSDANVYNTGVFGTQVRGSKRNVYNYFVKLEYSYTVNGEEYRSSQIYPHQDPSFSSEGDATELKTRFFKNKKVTVYYNPRNPNKTYLIYDTPSVALYVICAILFCLGVPLIALFASTRPGSMWFWDNPWSSGYQQPTMVNVQL